jgi:predicted kinase
MKRLKFIFIIFVLMYFAGHEVFAQSGTQQIDSMKLKEQKRQSAGNGNGQNTQSNSNNQTGNRYGTQTAKRVKSGRPDMTRARGARPPSIVRPSGSGIPKGVGKPGGAGRKGGR